MSCKNDVCSTLYSKNNLTYQVEEIISNEIERCYYEFNGLLQVLTQFTSTSPFKPDPDRYNSILNEYMAKFIKYNLLFEEITELAIEELCLDRTLMEDKVFNFYERILYITMKEEI